MGTEIEETKPVIDPNLLDNESKPLIKSSDEILTELFSTFNAEPPQIVETVDKSHRKHKKSKKKHKKKHKKKSKKHGRSSSDTDDSSDEESSRHKRHKRKKHNSESDTEKIKIIKTENNLAVNDYHEPEIEINIKDEFDKSIETDIKNDTNENNSQSQSKAAKKIQIKNLKFSSVYEANVKEAEEIQRKKAERYEDGEISGSEGTKSDELELDSTDEVSKVGNGLKKDKHAYSHHSRSSSHRSEEKIDKTKDKYYKHHTSNKENGHKHKSSKDDHKYKHKSEKDNRYKYRHDRDDSRSRYSRHRHRSRERSRDPHSSRSHRSRSRDHKRRSSSRSESRSKFDKKKLLEIARKNAIQMLKNGTLPGAVGLGPQAQEKVLAAIKSGGKSIDELTDFCRNLSKKEAMGDLSSVSSNDDENSGSDTEKPFNHPFQLKERPSSIVMNIPNATPLPIKTTQEKLMDKSTLLMQFPVSSGQQHRKTENEWVPVSPKKPDLPTAPKVTKPTVKPFVVGGALTTTNQTTPVVPQEVVPQPILPPGPQVMPPIAQPPLPPTPIDTSVFQPPEICKNLDIGSIVSQRLTAMRKLQENPNDVQALTELHKIQKQMQSWVTSKQMPGQFTGSTGAQILSPAELASGYQAWARKDQLQTATPVSGGMGMHLLQKMGWRPGEGLGKEKNGALTPLMLEVKLDKKGLVADEEVKTRKMPMKKSVNANTLQGKHPVSLLGEFASKRKLGPPQYECCFECGPAHKKNFLFKVRLNGLEYQPSVASPNKKQAKADAALLCLQQLGVLPS